MLAGGKKMSNITPLIGVIQIFFAIVIGLYFLNLLRSQQTSKVAVDKESRKEMEQLRKMRAISLTEPLAEKTRPASFAEIIGQEEGLRALRAALCGPNPQHVIIYGPPGVGKTAAARLVLEEAKRNSISPFGREAKFVELDATTARFDERGIADPLIGSVHDPIYQGAGPMGMAGIPQPKAGAVSKAHGGILFIDEIGELHSTQINKLLKVLEDRKVFLESAYYNQEDKNIPAHIHEIFQKGFPADFRMIGATTRLPDDIPPAIRSRCLEVFFRGLLPEETAFIAANAAKRINFFMGEDALAVIKKFAANGREAVNTVQIAAGLAQCDNGRKQLTMQDIEWVVNASQMSPRPEKKIPLRPQVGYVNGLAVYGPSMGTVIEIEVASHRAAQGKGEVHVTGVMEEEEVGSARRVLRRKSSAKSSVENVLTVLRDYLDVDPKDYHIHLNFPGGTPIDGPSAGISIATAIYSSLTGVAVANTVAMPGEISVRGYVRPIGGVACKVEAARQAGAKKVLIPRDNWQQAFDMSSELVVIPVDTLQEVFDHALVKGQRVAAGGPKMLTAAPL